METRPGQLFVSVVEAKGKAVSHPKKKIGVQVELHPGKFMIETRKIAGMVMVVVVVVSGGGGGGVEGKCKGDEVVG